jgi:hypothetical protein
MLILTASKSIKRHLTNTAHSLKIKLETQMTTSSKMDPSILVKVIPI